jgi:hypothetical protein
MTKELACIEVDNQCTVVGEYSIVFGFNNYSGNTSKQSGCAEKVVNFRAATGGLLGFCWCHSIPHHISFHVRL